MGLRRQDRATYATTVAMAHVPKMVLRPRLPLRAEYPRFFKHPEVLCTRIRGSARSALKEFGHGPYLRVSSVGALRALIAGLGEGAELVFQIGEVVGEFSSAGFEAEGIGRASCRERVGQYV